VKKKQVLNLGKQEGMHKVRSEIILNDSESVAVSQGGNKPTTKLAGGSTAWGKNNRS
jgi:hypothetical protein